MTFKDKASAEKFLAVESVKASEDAEEALLRKWQSDYFEEKQKEYEEKRSAKKEAKSKVKKAKEASAEEGGEDAAKTEEKEDQGEMLPKGSVLVFR